MNLNLKSEFLNSFDMIVCTQKHGIKAVGIYISIIALMYENGTVTGNANLPLDFHTLAVKFNEDEEVIKSIITDFKFFRIVKEHNEFFSVEVGKYFEEKKKQSERNSQNINKRWHKERTQEKPYQPPTPAVRSDEVAPKTEPQSEPAPMAAVPPPAPTGAQAKEITEKALNKKTESELTEAEKTEYDEILTYFYFHRHIKDANAECARFWNFYNRVGWKNSRGIIIKNKMSAAKIWNTGDAPKFTSDTTAFISMLENIFKNESHISIFDFIKGIKKVEVTDSNVVLYSTQQIADLIENNTELITTDFKLFYKKKKLEYQILKE